MCVSGLCIRGVTAVGGVGLASACWTLGQRAPQGDLVTVALRVVCML